MINFKFNIVICTISLVAVIFNACSNENRESISDHTNSEHVENMTASEQKNLFIIESDSINRSWEAIEDSNAKQRTADINPSFISVDSSGVGQVFIFNLYDEGYLAGEISRVSTDVYGQKSISGLLQEDKGSFVFTVNEDRLLGQLRLTDRDQIIQIGFHEELNEYVLTELHRKDMDVLPGSAPMRRGNN